MARFYPLVLVLSILLSALAGCTLPPPPVAGGANNAATDAGSQSSPADTPAPIPLKVSAAPFLSNSAFYIALEEGFFAEQGLAIELVQMARASEALPALAQGELDVTNTNITSAFLNIMARESGIRIVASTAQETAGMDCVYNGLLIRKGALNVSPENLSRDDLKDLRFGVILTFPGGYFLDTLLKRYDLSVDDVAIVDLPGSAATLAALQEGAVDVVHFAEPWVTRTLAADLADVWLSQTSVMPEAQSSVIAFGPSLLEGDSDAGVRFMVAYLKGVRQFGEGKTERNLEILSKYLELDRELLMSACLPQIPGDGVILTQSIEDFAAWAADRDFIDQAITGDKFWEPRFVQQANEILSRP